MTQELADKTLLKFTELKKNFTSSLDTCLDYSLLRDTMDNILYNNNNELFFTTLKPPTTNNSFKDLISSLKNYTISKAKITNTAISFITNTFEKCTYSCNLQDHIKKDTNSIAIHLLIYSRASLKENFHVKFNHDNTCISKLRFSTDSISYNKSLINFSCNIRKTHLYSIIYTPDEEKIYIDGELAWAIKREKLSIFPNSITLSLQGKKGGALEVSCYGMEIWNSTSKHLTFTSDEKDVFDEQILELIQENNFTQLYYLIKRIETICIKKHKTKILSLLEPFCDECIMQNKGINDWAIFGTIDRISSQEEAKILKNKFNLKFPEPILKVKNLTLNLYKNPAEIFSLKRILFKNKKLDNFTVNILSNINFNIYKGDFLGIIGQNGAGKSTLLRALAGMIPISKGKIKIHDSFLLLKAGTGTRPQLTGRENIYHAGTYMGIWGDKLDEISKDVIEFTELGSDIDKPFQFYSDGMKSKLVFSIATSYPPEILMLDELLSAGDISFRDKAGARLEKFIEDVGSAIVVTHSLSFVQKWCNKVLFVPKHDKENYFFGSPTEAINYYLNEIEN